MVDMDVDESYTALIVQGPFNKILPQVKETTNAPLYFYLLWAWSKIAGYSPIALRMLSVLFGMATVVTTYIVTKILISARAARWSALVMVLSPVWLFRARDARMYSLVGFLSILTLYVFYRALTSSRFLDWMMLVLVALPKIVDTPNSQDV
jgi:mannosyltransferase